MNHYAKIAGAVCAGILGAKFVEASVKTVAGVFTRAAAKVAGMNKAEDAPSTEAPKPEKKAPEKKGGQGKKDDNPGKGEKPAAEAE